MIRKTFVATIAALALATGAIAQNAQDPNQAQSDSAQQSAQQAGGQQGAQQGGAEMSDAASSNPDRAFAAVLVSHARMQKQLSDMVAQKATDPQVKQLAQDVANDGQQFRDKVQQAAQKAGITINQERMLPRDRAIMNHMQALPVDALQRNYVFFEAGANETNKLIAQWAAKNAQKPEIQQAAKDIADKLEQRTQTIQQLAQAEISTGGAQPAAGQVPPSTPNK